MYYKDCDLETGVNKILHNFANEENKDYNTINLYSNLIIKFVKENDKETLNENKQAEDRIYNLECDLEDKVNALRSAETYLDELKKIVSNMRKSETKEKLFESISIMELSIQ